MYSVLYSEGNRKDLHFIFKPLEKASLGAQEKVREKGIFSVLYSTPVKHVSYIRTSDSTVSKNVGIEPRTVASSALAVRCSNQPTGKVLFNTGC